MTTSPNDTVLVETKGGVATITLRDPVRGGRPR